jgi:hypothetical protein
MDSPTSKNLVVLSWNTQGVGDDDKCVIVRDAVTDANPSVACIQESKLAALSLGKLRSFLPSRLSCFSSRDSDGSREGIVTALDPSVFSLVASTPRTFTLTTVLVSTTTDLSITITNVYAPQITPSPLPLLTRCSPSFLLSPVLGLFVEISTSFAIPTRKTPLTSTRGLPPLSIVW